MQAGLDVAPQRQHRRARAGQTEPVLLVAERQTAGRGRLNRPWASEPGASLTFSLGLPMAPRDWSGLSLAVGVALADSLHPDLRIKWPNDLWLADRKLAGILIETAGAGGAGAARFVVVGVGINVWPRTADGLSTAPAWTQELRPADDAPAILACIVPALVQALQQFESQGFAAFRERFAARDALAGRGVALSDGMQGTAAGVGPDGALLVHTAGGMKQVTGSEISVRPRDPAAGS